MSTHTHPGGSAAVVDPAALDAMVVSMCAAVDAGDAETFGSFFSEDALYRFGNAEPLHGRDAVVAATAGAASALPWVRHHIDQIAHLDDQLFCRFTIHTAAADGSPVALPCVTVIWFRGGEIVDYRVHLDLSPALGPGKSKT